MSTSSTDILREFVPDVFVADGPTVPFLGFPYPTRMVIIRLYEGGGRNKNEQQTPVAWVWSPIALNDDLIHEIEMKVGGPVSYIVSPNKIHHIFLKEWSDQYPDAIIYLPPGLRERKVMSEKFTSMDEMIDLIPPQPAAPGGISAKNKDINDAIAQDDNDADDASTEEECRPLPSWKEEIDYVFFQSILMDEIVFYHKKSKTALFCDLIQRHTYETNPDLYHHSAATTTAVGSWWKKTIMNLDGVCGLEGSTPREWRLAFFGKNRADSRNARDVIVKEWKPTGMIIAHGECSKSDSTDIIERALGWI